MFDNPVLQKFLSIEFLGNTFGDFGLAFGVFFLILASLLLLKGVVISRLHTFAKKTATDIDDFLIGLLRQITVPLYVLIALYLASRSLVLPGGIQKAGQVFFVIVFTVKMVQILQTASDFFLRKWAAKTKEEDPTSAVAVGNLSKIVKVAFILGGFVFVLDNLGINITSVVAGLGIGGIAVALAAQAVLGDAFSSFAIFMDKPFKVGDFIIVGDMLGTVEHVGFKTTRIRSLGGEQLVFSNTDLTNSRIRNYKRMESRRVVFKLGVIYQTTLEQIKEVPGIIKGVILENKQARFDRAHFQSYGDFALIVEVVFYVLSPDYNIYMDVQQFINLRIMEEFKKRKIEFAYPTQRLYVTQTAPV